jgi:hypothetical protein
VVEGAMTKREAAIVSAYTGYLVGNFADFHGYIEEKMGNPVFTHEMADKAFVEKLKELSKPDFVAMVIE